MNSKIIILDFDGTIGDTRSLIVSFMQETLRTMNLPEHTDEECAAMIGLPLRETFTTLLGVDDAQGEACAATYRRIFDEKNRPELVPVFPHVGETIAELHRRGIVCTIATSRSRESLQAYLRAMGLTPYISYMLGADDVAQAKPHPEPVLKTLRELDFEPEEAIVVGDTTFDIDMGRRAGAMTVGVTYGNGTREQLAESQADHIIDDFAQLLSIV